MMSIAYKKVWKSNPNSIVTITRNLNESFSTLWIFFGGALIYKQHMCEILRKPSQFFTTVSTYDIMTNIMIFILYLHFIEVKNNSAARSWSCFVKKVVEISFHFWKRPPIGLNKHEYNFSINHIPLFEALAIHI